MTLESSSAGDKVIIKLAGRMDAETATQFDQFCDSLIAQGSTKIVVDLADLAYVSSMGLRSFIAVGKTLQEQGGKLWVCRASGLVKQVFTITRINLIFPLYEAVESALAEA